MLYRHKKVKKYLEGFIDHKSGKLVLYDEQKQRIDSIFSKKELEDGLELDMERHYCVVQEKVGNKTQTSMSEPMVSSRLPVGLRKKLHTHVDRSRLYMNQEKEELKVPDIKGRPDPPQRHQKRERETAIASNPQEELSNEQLLALFSSSNEQTLPLEHRHVSTTTTHMSHQKQDLSVSTKRNRFSAFVDPEESSDDETTILPSTHNETGIESFNRPLVPNAPTILPKVGVNHPNPEQEVNENSSGTSKKPLVKHKFKAAPLKPLPNEFRMASSMELNNSNKNENRSSSQSKQRGDKKASSRPKKPRLPQYQNVFGLSFNPQEESWRQYRKYRIPTAFQTMDAYKLCWRTALVEVMNLEIADIASKFGKALRKAPSSNLEQYMRSQKISFYENVQLKSMDGEKCLYFGSADRMDHVTLDIQNKEHHSVYSKGNLD
jgi:hypothetical protein